LGGALFLNIMGAGWRGHFVSRSTALAWLDLKSQKGRTLVSGNATLADPKISPDGNFVSLFATTTFG